MQYNIFYLDVIYNGQNIGMHFRNPIKLSSDELFKLCNYIPKNFSLTTDKYIHLIDENFEVIDCRKLFGLNNNKYTININRNKVLKQDNYELNFNIKASIKEPNSKQGFINILICDNFTKTNDKISFEGVKGFYDVLNNKIF
jgi:hypothetical protein